MWTRFSKVKTPTTRMAGKVAKRLRWSRYAKTRGGPFVRYALSGLGCASEQQLARVAAAAAGGFSLCIGLDVEGVVYGVTETNS